MVNSQRQRGRRNQAKTSTARQPTDQAQSGGRGHLSGLNRTAVSKRRRWRRCRRRGRAHQAIGAAAAMIERKRNSRKRSQLDIASETNGRQTAALHWWVKRPILTPASGSGQEKAEGEKGQAARTSSKLGKGDALEMWCYIYNHVYNKWATGHHLTHPVGTLNMKYLLSLHASVILDKIMKVIMYIFTLSIFTVPRS